MHIALNGWFWDRPDTGSGQYVRRLLHALRRLAPDVQFTLLLPPHIQQVEDLPPDVSLLRVSVPLGGELGKVWFEQFSAPRAACRVSADLLHVPYWAPPLSAPLPIVSTIHDVIALSLPVYRGGHLARLYTSLVAAGAQAADHILTDSQASKEEIITRLRIAPERITVAWLATDEGFHPRLGSERDSAVKEKYNLPERFVLYLGGYDIRKNVHTLLLAYTYVAEAAEAMGEDVPLILVGRPPQGWGTDRFPDLPGYIERLGLSEHVRWLGEVADADRPSLYRLAAVAVFPSRYEGFGLPPLEAMACGTPVVACEASSIPEIVGDAAFLVDPDDARGMAGAILSILLQPSLAGQLRNLGLSRTTLFSWRKTAEVTLAVYRQVLEAHRPHRAQP